jgi:hypothetical protein
MALCVVAGREGPKGCGAWVQGLRACGTLCLCGTGSVWDRGAQA